MRRILLCSTVVLAVLAAAPSAFACAALIAPSGNIELTRTTTLAAYVDGVEHYVTSFEFRGGGGKFGSIVPLPGVPSKVEKGGAWTLQRLLREVEPVRRTVALAAASSAEDSEAQVLYETKIDALDITILKGGGAEVGRWARRHGFELAGGADEVLSFYARRSPIFMAAAFDGERAADRGQATGQGTPVHLTIPVDNPWVPLRIFTVGLPPEDAIGADLFLLTDRRPATLFPGPGLLTERVEPASEALLADLRSDEGMQWLPAKGMWLSHHVLDTTAGRLKHDLAIDASGAGRPSPVDAGLVEPPAPKPEPTVAPPPPITATPAPTPDGTPFVALPPLPEDTDAGVPRGAVAGLSVGTVALAALAVWSLRPRLRRR